MAIQRGGQLARTISAAGPTDWLEVSGPWTLYLRDPSGSTVKVEYSDDDGATANELCNDGVPYSYDAADSIEFGNHGRMLVRVNCPAPYAGIPFKVTLSSNG